MRFTDPAYQLPVVSPLSVVKEFGTGANKPLLMRVVEEGTGVQAECVVKLKASERMTVEASMRECLAVFMAMEMELAIALPALVRIEEQFIGSQHGMDWYLRLTNSLGENYGTYFIQGQLILPKNMALDAAMKPLAADVIAFDALIQNFDRRNEKPNLILDGGELHLIDHELAFGFVHALPWNVNHEPWNLAEADKVSICNHLLYPKVKKTHLKMEAFAERVGRLDEAFWDKAWNQLPEPWKCQEQFDKIKNTMLAIRANRDTFVNQVSQILL